MTGDGPGSQYNVGGYDDDGAFFDAKGGTAFRQQLATFTTFRTSFAFGTNGWLTAEMSDRDGNRDGLPDSPPSLTTKMVGGAGRRCCRSRTARAASSSARRPRCPRRTGWR